MSKVNKDITFCVNIECESRNKCSRYFYRYEFKDDDAISVCCFGKYEERCEFYEAIE